MAYPKQLIGTYHSGKLNELVPTLPGNNRRVRVFSLAIGDVLADDDLWCAGWIQVTNALTSTTKSATDVILTPNALDVEASTAAGSYEIINNSSENVWTGGNHHRECFKVGGWTAPATFRAMPVAFVNFIGWSDSSHVPPKGSVLTVDKGYGQFSVQKFRNTSIVASLARTLGIGGSA